MTVWSGGVVLQNRSGCESRNSRMTRGEESEEKRDFSLRRPTLSQERKRKKKSACSVRNDGVAGGGETESGRKKRPAPFEMTVWRGRFQRSERGRKTSACSVRDDGVERWRGPFRGSG